MRRWAVLLLLPWANAHAEPFSCRALTSAARTIKTAHPPSTQNGSNCAKLGETSSNYILATDPQAPVEVHVISVHDGSFPIGLTRGGDDAPEKAVRVIVHRTEKPAVLYLNAHEAVSWELTLTKQSHVDRIILQGEGTQKILGVPQSIPIIQRPRDKVCARAHGWEKKFNRRGANYKMLIAGVRCSLGLRETSFQACGSGAVFEIPHYRKDNAPTQAAPDVPACPLDIEPDILYPRQATIRPYPQQADAVSRRPQRTLPPPAPPLPAPVPVPPRPHGGKISARALAILLDGDTSLATHDAIPDLITALKKGDARLRSRAADELGKMGPRAGAAVKPLIRALRKDKDTRVRASAALALGNIGAESAVRHLKKALRSSDANLRLSADTALKRMPF